MVKVKEVKVKTVKAAKVKTVKAAKVKTVKVALIKDKKIPDNVEIINAAGKNNLIIAKGKKTIKDIIIPKRKGEGRIPLLKILAAEKAGVIKSGDKVSLKDVYLNTRRSGKTYIQDKGHYTWMKTELKKAASKYTVEAVKRNGDNNNLIEEIKLIKV